MCKWRSSVYLYYKIPDIFTRMYKTPDSINFALEISAIVMHNVHCDIQNKNTLSGRRSSRIQHMTWDVVAHWLSR